MMTSKDEWINCLSKHYEIRNEEIEELMLMFLLDIEKHLTKLNAYQKNPGSIENAIDAIHGIKGSSAYLYLQELSVIANKLEKELRAPNKQNYSKILDELNIFFSGLKQLIMK